MNEDRRRFKFSKNAVIVSFLVIGLCLCAVAFAGKEINTNPLIMTGLWKKPSEISTLPLIMTGLGTDWQLKKLTTFPMEMTGTRVKLFKPAIDIGKGIGKGKQSREFQTAPEERAQSTPFRSDLMKQVPAAKFGGAQPDEEGKEMEIR